MSARTTPPFRADMVGSLLRTVPLKEARAKFAKGEIAADALRVVEDREIEKIIKKQVVLGLVTSKFGKLENKDDIKRRIDEATKYIALDQLCLSPQCGFASTEEGNVLAEDEQWAKLRMIVELADEVWG